MNHIKRKRERIVGKEKRERRLAYHESQSTIIHGSSMG